MISDLYNRKLNLGEILSASWKIYIRNFKYLLLFVFVVNFLALRINYAVFFPLNDFFQAMPSWLGPPQNFQKIVMLFTIISSVAAIKITANEAVSKAVTVSGLCQRILSCLWVSLGVSLVFMVLRWVFNLPILAVSHGLFSASGWRLGLLIAVFLPIQVGLYIYLSFVYQAVVVRGQSLIKAFRYSFRVVRGRWWKVFWAAIVIGFIPGIIGYFFMRIQAPSMVARHLLWSFKSLLGIFQTIGMTILFLNIDREGLAEKVDELMHPVDPEPLDR